MNRGFLKLTRGEDADFMVRHPLELALLTLIALRAKWTTTPSLSGLLPGEALIGDFESCGLTRQQYRTALKNLVKRGLVTTQPTNKGTIVRLINSKVFDINIEKPTT